MPITTLKVLASVLQLHGPGATIQSDHQGIDALLNNLRAKIRKKRPRFISDEAVLSEGQAQADFAERDTEGAAGFVEAGLSEGIRFTS